MILSLVILSLGGLIAASPAAAQDRTLPVGPVPAWVNPAPPATKQLPADGAPLQILLRDVQAKLSPQGDSQFTETRMKLLKPEALEAGNIRLEWDPQTENLTLHRLTVTRAGKVTDVLATQKFTVVQREQGLEAAMLDGRLTASLQIPGLEVGDEIDIASTEDHHDPVLAGHSQFMDSLPQSAIAGRVRVRAMWPASAPVTWKVTDDVPKTAPRRAGEQQEVAFEADGLPPSIATDGAPARYRVRRFFQASGFSDWKEVSALMAPLYVAATTLKPDSPIKAEAAKIKAAAADPAARTLLALQLVQNQTRYVYVGLDSGAYHPAAADETWTRRWGDCKAKTALLLSLLAELGIPAEPILADIGGLESAEGLLPQMTAFDHVLVRATLGGKSYYLDGTGIGDTNLSELQVFPYGVGLPIRAGGADIERLLAPLPEHPTVTSVIQIDASAGLREPAKVNMHLEFRGGSGFAMNRNITAVAHDQAVQAMKSAMTRSLPWMEVADVTWSYEPRRRLFTEDIKASGKVDWSKDVGGGPTLWYSLSDSGLGQLRSFKRDATQDQTAPFAVGYPLYTRSVATFRLPPGARFDRRGDTIAMTYGGVRFMRRVSQSGDTVVMYRGVRSLGPELPAKEAAADEARRPDLNPGTAWVWATDPAKAAPPAGDAKPAADAKSPPAAPDSRTLLADSSKAAMDGKLEAALALAEKAVAADPKSVPALAYRAALLFQLARWDLAADAYGAAIAASDKPNADYLRWRGQALRGARRWDDAEKAADAYAAAFPKDLGTFELRALVSEGRKDYDKALSIADEARAAFPNDPGVLRIRSNILWAADRRAQALGTLDDELRLDPDAETALSARGYMEMKLKQFEAARDDLNEARWMNPVDQGAISRLSELAEAQGDYAGAVRIYSEAIERFPKSAGMLNGRCWAQALGGLALDQAAKDCDAGLAMAPENAALMDSRAFVSFRQKKYADAIARYSAALKVRPDSSSSLYGRGLAKLRSGDATGGRADMADAVKQTPDVAEPYAAAGVRP